MVRRQLPGETETGTIRWYHRRQARHQCKQPGDAELLERIGPVQGDALVNLVRAGAVPPRDALPVGLTLLSALARLCRSDSASLLQRVA